MTLSHTPAHTTSHPDRFENEVTGRGYSVLHDTDAEDPRSWTHVKDAALWVYREPALTHSVAATRPVGNVAIDAFAHYWRERDSYTSAVRGALTLTRRYLAAFHAEKKLQVATATIRGYSQGDWLDVVCAVADGYGTPEDHIEEFRRWAFGDVWIVIPDDKPGISGIYADDAAKALEYYQQNFEDSCFEHSIKLKIRAENADEAQSKIDQVVMAIHESDALLAGVQVITPKNPDDESED